MNERIAMMNELDLERKKVRELYKIILSNSPVPESKPQLIIEPSTQTPLTPKRRGRPLGSKNKPKTTVRRVEINV
jgi:hypothetical protein